VHIDDTGVRWDVGSPRPEFAEPGVATWSELAGVAETADNGTVPDGLTVLRRAAIAADFLPLEADGPRISRGGATARARAAVRGATRRAGSERASPLERRDYSRLTTRVGRHLNCAEYPLSSRFPELARLPHVGTKLDPGEGSSCLQTRNVTFVFDPDAKPPTLVAVVYDQWEW
ncbi:MAG: hypothetical protein M3282_01660, partial [Gemmatimonadota bacterium]|nr:hypothetical protein [Gemmatimonadota bacterium]